MQYFLDGPNFNVSEQSLIHFSWNIGKRAAFTHMHFVNSPLGEEDVRYEIDTKMYDLINASTPLWVFVGKLT